MHPFPPVVRWALFPALAAIAGMAGGLLGWMLSDGGSFTPRLLAIGAGFGMAAAFAAVTTRRTWLSLLAAPAFALLSTSGAMAISETLWYGGAKAPNPWGELLRLLSQADMIALVGGTGFLQALAHQLSLTRRWPAALLLWLGASLLVAALGGLLAAPHEKPAVPCFLAGCSLAQITALLGARAVARRLRRE